METEDKHKETTNIATEKDKPIEVRAAIHKDSFTERIGAFFSTFLCLVGLIFGLIASGDLLGFHWDAVGAYCRMSDDFVSFLNGITEKDAGIIAKSFAITSVFGILGFHIGRSLRFLAAFIIGAALIISVLALVIKIVQFIFFKILQPIWDFLVMIFPYVLCVIGVIVGIAVIWMIIKFIIERIKGKGH